MTPEALDVLRKIHFGECAPEPRWHGLAATVALLVWGVAFVLVPWPVTFVSVVGLAAVAVHPRSRDWLGLFATRNERRNP